MTAKKGKRAVVSWLVLIGGLVATFVAFRMTWQAAENEARQRFDFAADSIRTRIVVRIASYEQVLRGAAGLFDASKDVSRSEWHAYTLRLDVGQHYPGIRGIGFAPWVRLDDVPAFIERARVDGVPDYSIKPAGERDGYLPILYLEPNDERNQRAIGFDMYSEKVRRQAIDSARDSGRPSVSGKVLLIQERETETPQAGFLMYLPLYRHDTPLDTIEQRRAAFLGVAYSPFRAGDLMAGILGEHTDLLSGRISDYRGIGIEIFDGDILSEASRLYPTGGMQGLPPGIPLFERLDPLQTNDRAWQLRIVTLPEFAETIDYRRAQIVLVAGCAVTLLLFALLHTQVTQRLRTQALAEELAQMANEAERRFSSLAETAQDGIVISDENGMVVTWNPGAERILGYSAEEMTGRSLMPLIAHRYLADVAGDNTEQLNQRLAGLLGKTIHVGFIHKEGYEVPVAESLSCWRTDRGTFYGAILRDMSETVRVEQSLREAIKAAEAADRFKSAFLANMSHEMRTPLNAVLGMSQILSRSKLAREQQDALRMIALSGQTLLNTINDILDYSRIEAGKLGLFVAPFDVQEMLDMMAAIMASNGAEKPVEMIISAAANLPESLMGDSLRLQQILINLVGNAIKFTASGEVELSVSLAEQSDDCRAVLRFVVRDTGIGMSAEQIERLYTPFTQADASTTRQFGGAGLGLSISKRLIDLMHGNISVQSTPGEGTRFIVELPFSPVHDPLPAMAETFASRHVLLVDDNPAARRAEHALAERLGWDIDEAGTLGEALQCLRNRQYMAPYDLVLMDWQLPDGGGDELLAALRDPCSGHHRTQVLVMASLAQRDEIQASTFAGMVRKIISKPLTFNSLAAAAEELGAQRDGMLVPVTHTALIDGPAIQLVELPEPEPQFSLVPDYSQLAGVRVLVVEDNEFNRIVASSFLDLVSMKVTLVEDGQQAVDWLREHADECDIVLMDVQMPVMDGFTATRIIRKELKLKLPIIAMTAGVMESERSQCIDAGMDDFVGKPVNADNLHRVLAEQLQMARVKERQMRHA